MPPQSLVGGQLQIKYLDVRELIWSMFECYHFIFEVTPNYWVIVEMYPFLNGVVGGSIPIMKSSLFLTEK
jgi:hypothetical protein